jgi:pimeloyl-ACP methyl ester carboxylesterase
MTTEPIRTKQKLPWLRWGKLALATSVFGYLCVLLFFTVFQRELVYVPTQVTMAAAEAVAAKNGFVPWLNKSGRLMGWKSAAKSDPVGSVLIAHGNAGWALNRAYMVPPIHAVAALDVYILEYPGFGPRQGSPDEETVLAAADLAFENLPTNLPIYLVSESIGCGVVAHLAQEHPAAVTGMAMFVPFDNLASVAQDHVPFIPAYFLLLDRYNPAEWLKDYRGPVKIVVAGSDEIVPPRLGVRLYDEYQGPKELEIIPGARHVDTFGEPAIWWRQVLAFWREHTAKQPAATASK